MDKVNGIMSELNDMANFKGFGESKEEEITNADGSRNWQTNILLDNVKRLEFELKVTKADYEASEQENARLKEENYQLQKDCQICENFIDFIPCKPIRDMDYDLQKVISQRDNYYHILQEIRSIITKAEEE